MAGNSSLGILFTRLEKFSNNETIDLTTWLRSFDRCCVIANKTDDLIKGQLLMLFVEGQAKAILEEFEVEQGTPQTYSDLIRKLKTCFDTVAARESKMAAFEIRTQQLEETEEEFMLALTKFYRAANPGIVGELFESAVKRNFCRASFLTSERIYLYFVMIRMLQMYHVRNY